MHSAITLTPKLLIASFDSEQAAIKHFHENELHVSYGEIKLRRSKPHEVFYLVAICPTQAEAFQTLGAIELRDRHARTSYFDLFNATSTKAAKTVRDPRLVAQQARKAYNDLLVSSEPFAHLPITKALRKRLEKKALKLEHRVRILYGKIPLRPYETLPATPSTETDSVI